MPSLSLKASVNYPVILSSGGGYTPNYPPYDPTGQFAGLVGWYDSSVASSVIKNGSNKVSAWKQLYTGDTQGAFLMGDLIQNTAANAPIYVSNQIYGTTVNKKGILYTDTSQNITASIPSQVNLRQVSIFMVTNQDIGTGVLNSVFELEDSQQNNIIDFRKSVNSPYLYTTTNSQSCSYEDFYLIKNMFGYVIDGTRGQHIASRSIGTSTTLYTTTTGLSTYGASFGESPFNIGSTNFPWDMLYLGQQYSLGTLGSIAEIIVYNNVVSESAFDAIFNYFQTKWF